MADISSSTVWQNTDSATPPVASGSADQFAPAVADSGAGSFGVAWATNTGVQVKFYDIVGDIDPGIAATTVSGPASGSYAGTTMAAATIGYGVAWEHKVDGTSSIQLRYIGLTGPMASVIDVSNDGKYQRDAAMSGYDLLNGKTHIGDGLNVVWISADSATSKYGQIMMQRFVE